MLAFSAFFHPSDAGFPVSMVCAANLVLLISCVTFSTGAPAPEAKPDPDFNPFRFGEFPRRKGRLLVDIHAAVSFYLQYEFTFVLRAEKKYQVILFHFS